jgi:hypothetical protein
VADTTVAGHLLAVAVPIWMMKSRSDRVLNCKTCPNLAPQTARFSL